MPLKTLLNLLKMSESKILISSWHHLKSILYLLMSRWTKQLTCVSKNSLVGKKSTTVFLKTNLNNNYAWLLKIHFFLFNDTYYEQVEGVAMGSTLGPTLANIFLCHWEEIWIKNTIQFQS